RVVVARHPKSRGRWAWRGQFVGGRFYLRCMAKVTTAVRCDECGNEVAKWLGRCPECQAWGTISEVGAKPGQQAVAGPVSSPARPIAQVDAEDAAHRPTGVPELDRVLGGGLVPGSVVLLAG